jgi:hypothetical protein
LVMGDLPLEQNGRSMHLNTHPHLRQRLIMSGAILLLPLYALTASTERGSPFSVYFFVFK